MVVSAYVAISDCLVVNVVFSRACDLPMNMRNYMMETRRQGTREKPVATNLDGGLLAIVDAAIKVRRIKTILVLLELEGCSI